MSFKVFLMPQLSPEWWEVRRGVPTASRFDSILTAKTRKLSASATDYMAELIGDVACLSPNYFTSQGRPVTQAMIHGIDCEPEARRYLEYDAGLKIEQVGFCMTNDLRFGTSPDGLIGLQRSAEPTGEWQGHPFYDATAEEVVELKCVTLKTQARYLMEQLLPIEYQQQCHGHVWVTKAKQCRFFSYSPGLAAFQKIVTPDDYTDALASALEEFWTKYQAALEQVRGIV